MDTARIDGERNDAELVAMARDGDGQAFAALYDRLAPRLLGFLVHQVGDVDLAEDLMQRTFMKVIEALPRFELRRGVPFRAWVYRIARNVVIDDHRTAHPASDLAAVGQLAADTLGPEDAFEALARRQELYAALEQLPPDEHDVIVYRFFAGLAPGEVAPLLHRSDGAVRILQHRALRHLRRALSTPNLQGAIVGADS